MYGTIARSDGKVVHENIPITLKARLIGTTPSLLVNDDHMFLIGLGIGANINTS